MNPGFDSMITIPVLRAQAYPHTWENHDIADLGVHHLVVDVSVREEGLVTLAASTRKAQTDSYGQEYDLMPAAARTLAKQLLAAARASEAGRGTRADVQPGERIIDLVSSSFERTDDGKVAVCIVAEEEGWTAESGLRLTEDDALELRAALGQAVEAVSGRDPQAFIHLSIRD